MSPKRFLDGMITGDVWSVHTTSEHRSNKFDGYRLSESTLEQLLDQGVETIVFIDPNHGRYVSTMEDWQDYGVHDGLAQWVHLRQSWMDRG